MVPAHPEVADGLNAPFGARCFLTSITRMFAALVRCLNAPFGARCFLTGQADNVVSQGNES